MSLVVPCTGCPAKLSAPESAAGKQIRCPKCKAAVPVPAFVPAEEVPVVDAKVTAPPPPAPAAAPKPKIDAHTTICAGCNAGVIVLGKIKNGVIRCPQCGFPNRAFGRAGGDEDENEAPKKKSRRNEEEDEDERPRKKKKRPVYDDDDEDERPRKMRRAPARSNGGGGAKVAVIVVGILLLVGGLGLGAYLLAGKGGVFAKKSPVPAGWKEYSYPQDGFKAYFPSAPQVVVNNNNPARFGIPPAGAGFAGAKELVEIESVSVYACGDTLFGGKAGGVSVTVTIERFRNGVPRSLRDNVTRLRSTKYGNIEAKRVRWLGRDAGEVVMGNIVMRVVYTDDAQIAVQLVGPNGARVTPEEENGFFDNFELVK